VLNEDEQPVLAVVLQLHQKRHRGADDADGTLRLRSLLFIQAPEDRDQ
jgi:hypothetical protein